ncbi:hypothetical protein C2W62_15225 [Candidatus Entotheonella serta]|nr:hypothetical protein C2W62_15225 [Candidatus Entotheonella serta]
MTQHATVSIAKAQRALGFSPCVSFEEGMKRTETWLKTCGYLTGMSQDDVRPLVPQPMSPPQPESPRETNQGTESKNQEPVHAIH